MTLHNREPGPRNAWKFLTFALLCTAVCVGCSDDPTVEVTTVCLELLPDEGIASGHVISRTGELSTCNYLDVELVATDIAGIHAAEIQVAYPNSIAILVLVEAGPLLLGSEDGIACGLALSEYGVDCFMTDDFANGTVDISITRTQQPPDSVDAPAEGAVLATLTFLQITSLANAQGPFEFNYGKLLDDGNGGATSPGTIIDVNVDPSTFVGGQMIIQQQ